MGASGWTYFTPYQEDIKIVLKDLQAEIFQKGEYCDPFKKYTDDYSIEDHLGETISHFDQGQMEAINKSIAFLKDRNKIKVDTMSDLRSKCAESGTHSIIDIRGIDDSLDLYQSGKAPDDILIKVLGTTTPSREVVNERGAPLQTLRGRWLCTYVLVYEHGEPVEVYFTGYSGD